MKPPRPALRVLNTELRGRRFPLTGETTRIGRSTECEVRLDLGSVSRVHARIEESDGIFRVRDLGSRNGIRVNGLRIPESELRPGDTLTVGDVELRFEMPPGAPPPPPRPGGAQAARPTAVQPGGERALTGLDLLAAARGAGPKGAQAAEPQAPPAAGRKLKLLSAVVLGMLVAAVGSAAWLYLSADQGQPVRAPVLVRVGERKWISYNRPLLRRLGDFADDRIIIEDDTIADVQKFAPMEFLVIGKAGGKTVARVTTQRGYVITLRIIVRGRLPDPLEALEEARLSDAERRRMAEEFIQNGLIIHDEKPYLAMQQYEKALAVLRPLSDKGSTYLQAKRLHADARERVDRGWKKIASQVNLFLKNRQYAPVVDLLTEAMELIPDETDPRHQKAAARRWDVIQLMLKAEERARRGRRGGLG